jgi:hypothetical protein
VQRAVNPPGEPAGVGASTSSAGPAGTGGRRRRPADPVRDEFDAIVAFLADIDVIATTDEDARVILSPGRRREAAMMRTIAGWALVSFAVAYLLTDPSGAARVRSRAFSTASGPPAHHSHTSSAVSRKGSPNGHLSSGTTCNPPDVASRHDI